MSYEIIHPPEIANLNRIQYSNLICERNFIAVGFMLVIYIIGWIKLLKNVIFSYWGVNWHNPKEQMSLGKRMDGIDVVYYGYFAFVANLRKVSFVAIKCSFDYHHVSWSLAFPTDSYWRCVLSTTHPNKTADHSLSFPGLPCPCRWTSPLF